MITKCFLRIDTQLRKHVVLALDARHRLLDIDEPTSERYRDWVQRGCQGLKPGWCRLGFHYAMDDAEAVGVRDGIADTREDVDEVLVVGHSTGAQLAVSALARVPERRVSAGPALGLLTLGQSIPMISLLPEADALRDDLARVKDVLDIFVRTGLSQIDELRPQVELLRKIAID